MKGKNKKMENDNFFNSLIGYKRQPQRFVRGDDEYDTDEKKKKSKKSKKLKKKIKELERNLEETKHKGKKGKKKLKKEINKLNSEHYNRQKEFREYNLYNKNQYLSENPKNNKSNKMVKYADSHIKEYIDNYIGQSLLNFMNNVQPLKNKVQQNSFDIIETKFKGE